MGKGHAKAPSQRQLRVGEEVRHMLAWILERGEIHDPGLAGVVLTITEVRISPDLRNATAYVMPLGGVNVPAVLEAINRAAPFLRRLLGRKIKLKRLPNLYFEADQSFKEAEHIDNLLKTPIVARDLEINNTKTKEGNEGDGA
jgi:ribosome-binding factor A